MQWFLMFSALSCAAIFPSFITSVNQCMNYLQRLSTAFINFFPSRAVKERKLRMYALMLEAKHCWGKMPIEFQPSLADKRSQ